MLQIPSEYSRELTNNDALIVLDDIVYQITAAVGFETLESDFTKEDINQFLEIVEFHNCFDSKSKGLNTYLPALYVYSGRAKPISTLTKTAQLQFNQINSGLQGILSTVNGLIKRGKKGELTAEERDYCVIYLQSIISQLSVIDIEKEILNKESRVQKYKPILEKL